MLWSSTSPVAAAAVAVAVVICCLLFVVVFVFSNVGEDTMKHPGPLDASLPRAAKRRRLITKESIVRDVQHAAISCAVARPLPVVTSVCLCATQVSFQEFLNHDVPFTQDILKRESAAINLHSLMNARTKDMLKMFDSLKKQRAAVHKARSKGERCAALHRVMWAVCRRRCLVVSVGGCVCIAN